MYYRLLEIIQRSGIHSQRDKEKEMKHVLSVIFDKRHGLNLRVMMSFIQFKIKKKTPHLNLSRKDDINEKKKKKALAQMIVTLLIFKRFKCEQAVCCAKLFHNRA